MTWLIAGVLLWSTVHFFPATATVRRADMLRSLGSNAYRGLFSLLIVVSVGLIVVGWHATAAAPVYVPPAWGRHLTFVLVLAGFILFAAARASTNIKRFIRHPQLTGVVAWSVGHLLANGDTRSVILFGGLGAWAIAEIFLLNRRDGAWQKPAPVSVRNDAIPLIAGIVVYVIVLFAHPWLSGVPLIGQS